MFCTCDTHRKVKFIPFLVRGHLFYSLGGTIKSSSRVVKERERGKLERKKSICGLTQEQNVNRINWDLLKPLRTCTWCSDFYPLYHPS